MLLGVLVRSDRQVGGAVSSFADDERENDAAAVNEALACVRATKQA